MPLIHSLLLSCLQAVTEFLPISSSGHLNLAQFLLGQKPSLLLDVFLNTGTLFSVLFFFRKKVSRFLSLLPLIVVGSAPAALLGLFLRENSILSDPALLPLFFLLNAFILFFTRFISIGKRGLDWKKALFIGLFQALALLPGVSRSGATITASLLLGLSLDRAFDFSFFLFIPASIGALVLNLPDLVSAPAFISPEALLSFFVTAFVGYFSLLLLKNLLKTKKLWFFSFYSLGLSLFTFLLTS